jgi:hypothetical protein
MTAERKVINLDELKQRIERLLAYYRNDNGREDKFVHSLELHLEQVNAGLRAERAARFREGLTLALAA